VTSTRNILSVFIAILLTGSFLAGTRPVAHADDIPVIEMKVEALDAGFRRLPDNQFIQGEEILIMVKIQNCTAMNEKEQLDKDYARMSKDGAVPPKTNLGLDITPVSIGSESNPWTEGVEFYTATPGQSGDKMAGAVRTNLDFQPNLLQRNAPESSLDFEQTEFWSISTSSTDVGEKSIIARFRIPDKSIPEEKSLLEQSVDFTIIDRASASGNDLARVTTYQAKDALANGEYAEAITAAREAIDYGPVSKIDESILYEMVGTAFESLGHLDSALTAYEEVLRLAEEFFPGRSSTEARMDPKISSLRSQLDDKE
jgi:tetratricopeptide (TPR) repeat protein